MNNWKRIGMYEVSDEGQVFSHYTGKILTGWKNHDGYVLVDLRIKKERKHFQVHRLVWETFVGKIPEGYELDHIDCNPQNNRLENLRVVTHLENIRNPITMKKRADALKKLAQSPEWRRKNSEGIKKRLKPVLQIDCNTGHVIREWDCSANVQRELGIWSSSILNCCKGRLKTTGGFKWRFAS